MERPQQMAIGKHAANISHLRGDIGAEAMTERLPWRCLVTGNPVGTDTQMIGAPCQCQVCRAADEIERLLAAIDQSTDALNKSTDNLNRAADQIERCDAEIERLRKENAVMREALEIIAGRRQCIDNLMGNKDVAYAALEWKPLKTLSREKIGD